MSRCLYLHLINLKTDMRWLVISSLFASPEYADIASRLNQEVSKLSELTMSPMRLSRGFGKRCLLTTWRRRRRRRRGPCFIAYPPDDEARNDVFWANAKAVNRIGVIFDIQHQDKACSLPFPYSAHYLNDHNNVAWSNRSIVLGMSGFDSHILLQVISGALVIFAMEFGTTVFYRYLVKSSTTLATEKHDTSSFNLPRQRQNQPPILTAFNSDSWLEVSCELKLKSMRSRDEDALKRVPNILSPGITSPLDKEIVRKIMAGAIALMSWAWKWPY